MDVQILNLEALFTKNIRYDIPLFQRRYVWEQEEQWEPLWEDVRNTAENCIEEKGPNQAHFLGAVVIQGRLQPVGRLDLRIVVDGQQRLTTMQLLLDAAQEVFEQRGYDDLAEYFNEFVLNKRTFQGGDPDKAFKVWPTMGDQDAFRQTMHNHLPSDEYRESRIVRAHEFFKLQISQWLDEQPDQTDTRAEALERTLAYLLQMVVIDLAPNEEPHVIFETLNARGTPLLQSDLVKNLMLFEAGQEDSSDTTRIWGFDTEWWNEEVFQGRLLRPRVDAFLNFWLVMRRREEIAHNDVFAVFRRYFASEGNSDINAVADDLHKAGKAYMALERREVSDEVKPFLYRIGVLRAGVLTPALMWLLSSDVPMEQILRALQALESYLVRRMVCGMTTRGYGRLFIGLVSALEEAGPENAGEAVVQYLKGQTAYATQWPDDQQLEDAFLQRPVYRLMTQGRTRIVLEGIETGLRTNKAGDQSVPRDLTIEHVMPRAWRRRSLWSLPADVEDEGRAAANRDRLIHTMGNLTLANGRLNTSLSNRPWEEKRQELHDHIVLFLNKDLVKEQEWNEDRIETRARSLVQVAIKVWPYADCV